MKTIGLALTIILVLTGCGKKDDTSSIAEPNPGPGEQDVSSLPGSDVDEKEQRAAFMEGANGSTKNDRDLFLQKEKAPSDQPFPKILDRKSQSPSGNKQKNPREMSVSQLQDEVKKCTGKIKENNNRLTVLRQEIQFLPKDVLESPRSTYLNNTASRLQKNTRDLTSRLAVYNGELQSRQAP